MNRALRGLCSLPDPWRNARAWLEARALASQTEGVLNAIKQTGIPASSAVNFLEGLGEPGLTAMVDAVDRDLANPPKEASATVRVEVDVPRAREKFSLDLGVGHTLYDAVVLDTELAPFLQ